MVNQTQQVQSLFGRDSCCPPRERTDLSTELAQERHALRQTFMCGRGARKLQVCAPVNELVHAEVNFVLPSIKLVQVCVKIMLPSIN